MKGHRKGSKLDNALTFLLSGQTLTTYIAETMFGYARYQAGISRLRKQGWQIDTVNNDPVAYRLGSINKMRLGKPKGAKRGMTAQVLGGLRVKWLSHKEAEAMYGCKHLASTINYLRRFYRVADRKFTTPAGEVCTEYTMMGVAQ